jgi:protoporphyrinogen oxidase
MNHQDANGAIVIAGAGLTGLMSALRLTKLHPKKKIILFDRSSTPGGMYGTLAYEEKWKFDYGMHVIYESCNPKVDELYREVMPEEEWHIYEKNEKDIAGLYFRGSLQNYSHYIDLRKYPDSSRERFIGSLLRNLEAPPVNNPKNAYEFLYNQFGPEIVDEIHRPILQRMYGVEPEEMAVFATKVTALDRVVLFDPSTMLDLMQSPKLRARLAYADQLNLPPLRTNDQKALYPRKFGMSNFVDRLCKHLIAKGVEILTDTSIAAISQNNGRIEAVSLTHAQSGTRAIAVDKFLWTVGWPPLAKELGVSLADIKFQKGPAIVFLNLVFNKPLAMDRLYYFYCYDENFATFRVTNYTNYCPDASNGAGFPVCLELWPSKIGRNASELSLSECIQLSLDELKKFGVIDDKHELVFAQMESKAGEFPMPSVVNAKALAEIRSRVEKCAAANLMVAGVMAKDGLFFLPDVLNDAFEQLETF